MKPTQLSRYFRDPGVAAWRKLLIAAAGLYVVMPVDLIPDVLPLVGWLDDVGVVGAVAAFLIRDVRRHAAVVTAPRR